MSICTNTKCSCRCHQERGGCCDMQTCGSFNSNSAAAVWREKMRPRRGQ